jgi:hypothetical protein
VEFKIDNHTQNALKNRVVVKVKVRANVVQVVVVIAVSFETLGNLLGRRASVKPLTKDCATITDDPFPDSQCAHEQTTR